MKRIALFFLFAIITFFPIKAFALNYSFDNTSNINFEISDIDWEEKSLLTETEFIKKKWENDCGKLMFSEADAYSDFTQEELEGLTRIDFNDSFIDQQFAETFIKSQEEIVSIEYYTIVDYELKFIEIKGVANEYNYIDCRMFYTINKGYLIGFLYYGDQSEACTNIVRDTVKNTKKNGIDLGDLNITKKDNSLKFDEQINTEKDNGLNKILIIIMNLVLTILFYMTYPLIRLKINREKFNDKNAKKIAMWNSIIIGMIFLLLSSKTGQNWTGGAAIVYYYINLAILSK